MKKIIHTHPHCKSCISMLEDNTIACDINSNIYGLDQTTEQFVESLQESYKSEFLISKVKMNKALDKNAEDQKRLNQLQEIKENLYKKYVINKPIKKIIHEHKAYDSYIAMLDDKTVIYCIGYALNNMKTNEKISVEEFIEFLQIKYHSKLQESRSNLNEAFDKNAEDQKRLNQLREIKEVLYK